LPTLNIEQTMRRYHMTNHLTVAALAAASGIAVASLIPEIPQAIHTAIDVVTGSDSPRILEGTGGAQQRRPKGDADRERPERIMARASG